MCAPVKQILDTLPSLRVLDGERFDEEFLERRRKERGPKSSRQRWNEKIQLKREERERKKKEWIVASMVNDGGSGVKKNGKKRRRRNTETMPTKKQKQ